MSRLHYLYEQQETGKERFIYYCSSCSCILDVRRALGPANETINSKGRCIGCGRLLDGNIECRFAPISEEWSEAYLTKAPPVGRKTPDFIRASTIEHFSLGFPSLDTLLRPLCSGRMVVMSGTAASTVAELATFRAQLPVEVGGLDSVVLFIDGGNRSDPYLFSSFAKQHQLRPSTAMRRVANCRVFTLYQLAALVSEHLVKAVKDYAAKLVVISDVLGTFNEPELDEREARRVLSAVEKGVRQVKQDALVVATLPSPNKYDETVAAWADTMVSMESAEGNVQAGLLKHWNRPPGISSFKMKQLLRVVR